MKATGIVRKVDELGSLFGVSVQLIKDRTIAVTLGTGIGILFGVVLFPEKA